MGITYAGTTMAVVDALPASQDAAGFAALAWEAGTCALRDVPGIMREWAKVTEDLVCRDTNSDVKGSAKWSPVTFRLSRLSGDAAQAIYTSLEANRSGVGSFRMVLPSNGGTIYFTAQVSKFALADGGTQDTIHTGEVELLIQTTPVVV